MHTHTEDIALKTVILAGLALALAACGDEPPAAARQAPIVDTITLHGESVPNVVELPGRIEAVRTAEVRARTDGIVVQRVYQEGGDVKAGAPLFRIDARDYRAQVNQSKANLQRALAARDGAASVVKRYTPLAREKAVSGQEFDSARSTLDQAEAQVSEARAALERSQLQLSYTNVTSPIDGRVSRAEVTEGALVSAAQGTLMTRVDQMSPVYAVFSQSSAEILDFVRQLRSGAMRLDSPSKVTVTLILENGEVYGPVGELDFAESSVDLHTGSQIVRAHFPNPQILLKPGQFVRGRISAGAIANGILIPARAVQLHGEQASVFVLARDSTVTSRPVELGALLGDRWIISSGLKAGENLIVDGWQKVRPGQRVRTRSNASAGIAPGPEADRG